MERDCINNFLDLISAFFHLRIISRIWNQYANNSRKILIPKFSNNSKRTNKFPQPRFSFLPSPESFPMQMRILPNRPFLDSKRWRIRNLKLIREYIKKVREGGENRLERTIGKNLVTRHRGIRQQTEPVDGRPVIGSHRVYNAVVSKSRNKWSRRNAKKNRGARRPNYSLPAARRGGRRRFA